MTAAPGRILSFQLLLYIVFLIPCVLVAQDEVPSYVHTEWKLQKENHGVQIYARWKEYQDTYARQLKVRMEVDASMDAVVATILDDKIADKWMKRVSEFYHFDQADHYNWYTYSLIDLPWPLDDQDMITKNTLTIDENRDEILINLEATPDYLDKIEKANRILFFEGSWLIQKLKEKDASYLEYHLFAQPNKLLPRWILDPIVESGLLSTMKDMRELVISKHKNGVRLSFLH